MSNIERQVQTMTKVAPLTNSVPQKFYVTENSISTHILGDAPPGKLRTGSIVTNESKPGSFGFVATHGKKAEPIMLTQVFSNNEVSLTRNFTFVPLPESVKAGRPMQIGLHIAGPDKNDPASASKTRQLLHDGNGTYNLIPILVGPGSVSLAENWTSEECGLAGFELAPDINWPSLVKGVINAVPVLAEAGLSIYKEINRMDDQDNNTEEPEFIFGALAGLISKVAVPFISALI